MIILASASPRRRELLEQIGCCFRVVVSEAEEKMSQELSLQELVLHNAGLKARAAAVLEPELPVLGADTVVSLDGHIYGKPEDTNEAVQMLRSLSGRTHEVSTGIAFVKDGRLWQAVETTRVSFAELSEEEIVRYAECGEPDDKAGAYAIQGRAAVFIEGIHGSYSNVVGLPLHCVAALAIKAGINLYDDYGKGLTDRGETS